MHATNTVRTIQKEIKLSKHNGCGKSTAAHRDPAWALECCLEVPVRCFLGMLLAQRNEPAYLLPQPVHATLLPVLAPMVPAVGVCVPVPVESAVTVLTSVTETGGSR